MAAAAHCAASPAAPYSAAKAAFPMTDPIEPPRIFPTIRCADARALRDWLVDTIGFTEHACYEDEGIIVHAELAFGSAMLMLGQHRDDAYARSLGPLDGRRTDALYIAVDDADALFARVAPSGVKIEQPLYDTPYGSREFTLRDAEGNLWTFGTYWPQRNRA